MDIWPNLADIAKNKSIDKQLRFAEEFQGKVDVEDDFGSGIGQKDYVHSRMRKRHEKNVRNNNNRKMLDYYQIHNLVVP